MSVPRKIYALLEPPERKRAIGLLVLMVIGMVLETLGIGLVIPTIALLTQPDLADRQPFLRTLFAWMGNPSQTQIIRGGMLLLVAMNLVKAVFLAYLTWLRTKFTFDVQAHISQRLFATYLRQPYAFHLQRNSAQLIRNATTEVSMFSAVLGYVLIVVTEGLVLLGVAVLLLVVEPMGAVIVGIVLGSATVAFHTFTRPHIARWGAARQHHEGLRIQHLQQGLGGVKDVKLLGREQNFLAEYSVHSNAYAKLSHAHQTLFAIPLLWMELLAVVGLATLVLTMLAQGRAVDSILPALGLFAAAAFRLTPSVNRLLGAVQYVRFGVPVVNTLHHELEILAPPVTPKGPDRPPLHTDIRLSAVSFTYPAAHAPSIIDLSLIVRKNECVGIIGPSGSGKTTLVDVILGLLAPSHGQVLVDGHDIQQNVRAWQDQIGYVSQSIYLTDDTLRRNVAVGLPNDQIDEAAVRHAITAAQLEEFVASLPNGLETMVGERGVRLSGGQRQRIAIARALYHDPPVLVLDEATSSLDTAIERGVMDSVMALQGDKTILIVAHRLSTVERCDRLYRLEHGKVAAEGATEDMLGTSRAV